MSSKNCSKNRVFCQNAVTQTSNISKKPPPKNALKKVIYISCRFSVLKVIKSIMLFTVLSLLLLFMARLFKLRRNKSKWRLVCAPSFSVLHHLLQRMILGMVVSHYVPYRAIRAGTSLSDSKGASAALSTGLCVMICFCIYHFWGNFGGDYSLSRDLFFKRVVICF